MYFNLLIEFLEMAHSSMFHFLTFLLSLLLKYSVTSIIPENAADVDKCVNGCGIVEDVYPGPDTPDSPMFRVSEWRNSDIFIFAFYDKNNFLLFILFWNMLSSEWQQLTFRKSCSRHIKNGKFLMHIYCLEMEL